MIEATTQILKQRPNWSSEIRALEDLRGVEYERKIAPIAGAILMDVCEDWGWKVMAEHLTPRFGETHLRLKSLIHRAPRVPNLDTSRFQTPGLIIVEHKLRWLGLGVNNDPLFRVATPDVYGKRLYLKGFPRMYLDLRYVYGDFSAQLTMTNRAWNPPWQEGDAFRSYHFDGALALALANLFDRAAAQWWQDHVGRPQCSNPKTK